MDKEKQDTLCLFRIKVKAALEWGKAMGLTAEEMDSIVREAMTESETECTNQA